MDRYNSTFEFLAEQWKYYVVKFMQEFDKTISKNFKIKAKF